MSFWDIIWFIFIAYIFIAFLMVLFSIIADIFRDDELGGGAKAVWLLAMIVLPFLTMFVYLISRGKGMSERSFRRSKELQAQQESYIREVAATNSGTATPSATDQVAQAKSLLDSGAISQAEYETLKAKALA